MGTEAETSKTTTDHDEIRRWSEDRGGTPAIVRDTRDDDGGGVLRIDFPGGAGTESLEHTSWEEWFRVFEDRTLAFLYQDEKAGGEGSTFFKLVRRNGE
ncbi:MAG: hypothetical protein M3301_03110 [Chloroflexota bacterium]|nr:hypothetical protein [Chloroflexota bacterium]